MTKSDAKRIFGNASKLAKALDVSPQAISQWPDKLTQRQSDEITGAAIRLKLQTLEDVEKILRQAA